MDYGRFWASLLPTTTYEIIHRHAAVQQVSISLVNECRKNEIFAVSEVSAGIYLDKSGTSTGLHRHLSRPASTVVKSAVRTRTELPAVLID